MTPSFKSLRYTTAIAVSLVTISTANQAQAQCAPAATSGNDTINCGAGTTTSGPFIIGLGTDTLTNDGTIDGGASTALRFVAGIGGTGGSSFGGSVTNSATGQIISNSAAATIDIGFENTFGQITNEGLIENTGAGSAIAFDFTSTISEITGAITNNGVIRGNVGFSIGVDTTTSTPAGVFISGGIVNSGTIEGTGGTAIVLGDQLSGMTPITINGGEIIGNVVDNDPTRGFSPVTITGSGFDTEGDFTVSSLTVNAGEEFRISTGDTFQANTLTVNAGSTINFEVDAGGTVGNLDITGGAIDLTGAGIGAEVNPAADGVIMDGDTILIGQGVEEFVSAILAAAD